MKSLRLAVGLLSIAAAGCTFNFKNFIKSPPAPPTCVLRADATKDEIIAHLNDNTRRLTSWRSTDLDISTTTPIGLPISLKAYLAVESPKNFRLKAKSILGDEADFGSNQERFWFWMRRSKPKHVYTVRHDDFDAIRGQFPIPFRPDWVMEALGVIPLDPAQFTMQPRLPDATIVSLVAHQKTPDGRTVRRVVLVDSCVGRIISQSLYDSSGRTIASATFNDYHYDPTSGITLARQIDLDWPQTKTAMTLKIRTVQLNPGPMPPIMWEMPKFDDYAELDLAKHLGRTVSRRPPTNRQNQYADAGKRNSVPTPEQVGRVKIGAGTDSAAQSPPENDRPVFADERAAPAPVNERPPFIDERPSGSTPSPRFRSPVIVPVRNRVPADGQAKPFPG